MNALLLTTILVVPFHSRDHPSTPRLGRMPLGSCAPREREPPCSISASNQAATAFRRPGREDPDALWMGGWAIVILAGERAVGLGAIERALELNPNSALAWNFNGWVQGFSNCPALAIEALQRAMRLSPLDPQRWMFEGGLALARLNAGRYEEAVEWADRALQENTRAMAVLRFKAAACGQLGRTEEGRECVRRLRELVPGSTVASAKESHGFVSPEVLAIYIEGLRKAGLPEE